MKLLSVIIPCYNSEAYMENSIKSAMHGGNKIEILVIDDGSSDNTLEIARRYEQKYPDIVRTIYQENKGHGGAINTGISNAAGKYIKVLDSDDRLSKSAIKKVINLLEEMDTIGQNLDMLITKFVYDKQGMIHKKVMGYKFAMPEGCVFGWDRVHYHKAQYLLMHSVIYKREVLIKSGLKLPEHTFYVDNIFVYQPLPYVKDIYYLNVVLYQYFIGRADQSVNEAVMVKRIDQQFRVNKLMIDIYNESLFGNTYVEKAMRHYLDIVMCISSIVAIIGGTEESLGKKKELWDYLEENNPALYKKLRYSLFGIVMNLPGKAGRKLSYILYRAAQKIVGFN